MRKMYLFSLCWFACIRSVFPGNPVAWMYDAAIPVIAGKQENIVCEIRLESENGGELVNEIVFTCHGLPDTPGTTVGLFYSGTSSVLPSRTPSQAISQKVSEAGGSQSVYYHPAYSLPKGKRNFTDKPLVFPAGTRLIKGKNYFWVSLRTATNISLDTQFTVEIKQVTVNGKTIPVQREKEKQVIHRVGYAVRQAGDNGIHSYRIPGLITSTKGSLLAIYDMRHQTPIDLQEDIDVGLSRSTDGGKSWEAMRTILDMGEYNGLPRSQNGTGDAAILVDRTTGTLWVAALWVHGLANSRASVNAAMGMLPEDGTGQLLLIKSDDDGQTWSAPANITNQVKEAGWTLFFQGPGRGLCMQDGTLVFPVQYKVSGEAVQNRVALIYSRDHGKTWRRSNQVEIEGSVSEPQVAEITPGELMLNMRTDRPFRLVAISSDLGFTWKEHPSSGKTLTEPGCMGSLLAIKAGENRLKKDLLLFSNPDHPAVRPSMNGRKNITVKGSTDNGLTWPDKYRILLDEETGWGYSCLTLIDPETVGILYEGSTAQLVFQRIKLKELFGEE